MQIKYDVIYPMGANCATAQYLKKQNLRSSSGVFDWIKGDDPKDPFIALALGFDNFFNIEDLEARPSDDAVRATYYNKRNTFIFMHDFPAGVSLQQSFPAAKEKYDRRIARFVKNLNSSKTLLVWYGEGGELISEEEILQLTTSIRARYQAQIDFLFIQYCDTEDQAKTKIIAPGVSNCTLQQGARISGNLMWDAGRINPLFKNISINEPRVAGLYKNHIKPAVIRLASNLILNRAARHKFIERHLGK